MELYKIECKHCKHIRSIVEAEGGAASGAIRRTSYASLLRSQDDRRGLTSIYLYKKAQDIALLPDVTELGI